MIIELSVPSEEPIDVSDAKGRLLIRVKKGVEWRWPETTIVLEGLNQDITDFCFLIPCKLKFGFESLKNLRELMLENCWSDKQLILPNTLERVSLTSCKFPSVRGFSIDKMQSLTLSNLKVEEAVSLPRHVERLGLYCLEIGKGIQFSSFPRKIDYLTIHGQSEQLIDLDPIVDEIKNATGNISIACAKSTKELRFDCERLDWIGCSLENGASLSGSINILEFEDDQVEAISKNLKSRKLYASGPLSDEDREFLLSRSKSYDKESYLYTHFQS